MTQHIIRVAGLVTVFSLALGPVAPVSAALGDNLTEENIQNAQQAADEAKDSATTKAQEAGYTFDQFKAKLVETIEKALAKLEKAEQTIMNNAYLTQATKNELVEGMNNVESALEAYMRKLESVTSMDELEALTDEVIAYLKANKGAIQASVQQTVNVLYGEIEKTMEAIVAKAQSTLAAMKRTCPEQTATIDETQTQIDQLQDLGEQLEAEVKAKDNAGAKAVVQQMKPIVKELSKDLKVLYQACY